MSAPSEVDVAAVVDEIREDVRRRQAAGGYPAELMARLRAELSIAEDDEPLEALAQVDLYRQPASARPVVGRAITLAKRALRRSLAWYIQPIGLDQNRFNLAVARELHALERRVARTETPWRRPAGAPDPEAGLGPSSEALEASRVDVVVRACAAAPRGAVVVLGPLRRVAAALRSRGLDVVDAPAGWMPGARPEDPVESLESWERGSLAVVVAPGILPLLSGADLLGLVPLAAARLAPGGRLVMDAPDPATPPGSAALDPSAVRSIDAAVMRRLCEAAGLFVAEEARLDTGGGPGWCAVVAVRQA